MLGQPKMITSGPTRLHHAMATPHVSRPNKRSLRHQWVPLKCTSNKQEGQQADNVPVASTSYPDPSASEPKKKPAVVNDGMNTVNLYDPVATASRFLTRRFGMVGGLGLVAILALVEGSEIIKAALEEQQDEADGAVRVELASGVSYLDLKLGRGASPGAGDFVGVNVSVKDSNGSVLFDSKGPGGRPLAFTYGKRPYSSVVCIGLEEGIASMKRGGTREIKIPPSLTYGPKDTLTYLVTLEDVSPTYI